jgi:hypothetical protein
VKKELFLFGHFFLLGAGSVLFYDCLRVIRRIFSHGILWISVEDFLFAALAGGWFFLRLCGWNDGILRGYLLLAAALGAFVSAVCFEKILLFAQNRLKKWRKAATMGVKKIRRARSYGETEKKKAS